MQTICNIKSKVIAEIHRHLLPSQTSSLWFVFYFSVFLWISLKSGQKASTEIDKELLVRSSRLCNFSPLNLSRRQERKEESVSPCVCVRVVNGAVSLLPTDSLIMEGFYDDGASVCDEALILSGLQCAYLQQITASEKSHRLSLKLNSVSWEMNTNSDKYEPVAHPADSQPAAEPKLSFISSHTGCFPPYKVRKE